MAEFTFSVLTPHRFLTRSARVFRDRPAIVDGDRTFTYGELDRRCSAGAGALHALGVRPGDRVAALCSNSHVMLELHYSVPRAAGVLVPLNVRLAEPELDYILRHSGAKVLICTDEHADRGRRLAAAVDIRAVVAGEDPDEYESLLAAAEPLLTPVDERDPIAINYTSGTTGRPKGVVYHHRGAYLQALAMAYHCDLRSHSSYLWTLPMFHCNGWCFTWGVTAAGARHVCLRSVVPSEIWRLLRDEGVTHLSAAPTVLTMIAEAPEAADGNPGRHVHVDTGGAPPTPAMLERLARLDMSVTHLYGLTETYGPIVVNDWQPEWDALPEGRRAEINARQGVGNVIADMPRVADPQSGKDVAWDASTVGEILVRGDDVMLGYHDDPDGTAAASANGWLRTGDLAVVHPDGYLEIVDRSKDVIISGGENIASVEVERVLSEHPAVLESAVVGRPDDRWGEVPVAFVTLRPGASANADELIDFVRTRLAGFKAPKSVFFGDIPKTSTGKLQKHVLRQQLG